MMGSFHLLPSVRVPWRSLKGSFSFTWFGGAIPDCLGLAPHSALGFTSGRLCGAYGVLVIKRGLGSPNLVHPRPFSKRFFSTFTLLSQPWKMRFCSIKGKPSAYSADLDSILFGGCGQQCPGAYSSLYTPGSVLTTFGDHMWRWESNVGWLCAKQVP